MDQLDCKAVCRCGEFAFRVRYRSPDEDLIEWMNGVVRPGMSATHATLSPTCSREQCDLMVPIDDTARGLGMKPVMH